MNITESQLSQQLHALGNRRLDMVSDLAHEGENDGIGAALLLALGSRETNMRNIVGDSGHGRGWLQIDDRFHNMWLSKHRGCLSGTYTTKFASLPSARPSETPSQSRARHDPAPRASDGDMPTPASAMISSAMRPCTTSLPASVPA